MALARPTIALRSASASCYSCQQWALRSFIASIGGSALIPPIQRRALSRTPQRPNEARERIQQDEHALNDINDVGKLGALDRLGAEPTTHDDAPEESPPSDPSIPWYLQPHHQASQPAPPPESPMAARQRIPNLPAHPPPVLESLLHNLSIDQGMDDLTLLDLRALDPPPALGTNLLMLLGTARSEKHLHVAADRLCRWLRTEHKISPFADGLLGRNELKLKLRRRAKRTRLMSGGVGGATASDVDLEEGIRTGWVCVNIGRVQGGELPEQAKEREERSKEVVGFGKQEDGCNVVVQMMTEEKRGEIDLERLWMGMLRRQGKERETDAEDGPSNGGGQHVIAQELDPAGMAESVGSVQRDAALSAS